MAAESVAVFASTGVRIELPPLRERPEDIRWLTELILKQITAEQGMPIAMSELFLRDLMARN